jgi:hypothetical protein
MAFTAALELEYADEPGLHMNAEPDPMFTIRP